MGKLIDWFWLKFERTFHRLLGRNEKYWLSRVRGLIHIGANDGEERTLYQQYGISVLWVEALPDVFETLCRNLEGSLNQTALNAVLTDKAGEEISFFVSTNEGKSSSIFEFAKHRDIWPDVNTSQEVKLTSSTLESLISEHSIDISHYDAMLLDVQGAELRVLRGAQELIQSFKFVIVEAADFESYKGGCTLAEVGAFMENHGFYQVFKRRFAFKSGLGSYYDVLYEREVL